jgi:putative ABC transport system ATP-binding protein
MRERPDSLQARFEGHQDNPLIELRQVHHGFDEGRIVALAGVDLAIREGGSIAILGRSGSGKSCLVNIMTGIDAPRAGMVLWKGNMVASPVEWAHLRHEEIGIVFQEFNLLPTLTAAENVEVALFGRGMRQAERRDRAASALQRVGLAARRNHKPSQLSGGERQRVAIARAIVHTPALIVADEPTGSLDSGTSRAIVDLLFAMRAELAVTLVIVTHDESLAARCTRRLRLADGLIVSDERDEVLPA